MAQYLTILYPADSSTPAQSNGIFFAWGTAAGGHGITTVVLSKIRNETDSTDMNLGTYSWQIPTAQIPGYPAVWAYELRSLATGKSYRLDFTALSGTTPVGDTLEIHVSF